MKNAVAEPVVRERRSILFDLPSQRLHKGDIGSVVRKGENFYTLIFKGRFVTLTADKVSAPIEDADA